MINRKISLAFLVFLCHGSQINMVHAISIPFFSLFRQQQQPQEQKEARIINADHGGGSGVALSPSSSSSAFLAGGSFVPGPSPWISGTRDQFIRDQLVVLHPDSPQNRDAWKESGYLTQEETEPVISKDINGNDGILFLSSAPRMPPARQRKQPPGRKSKQHPTNQPQQQEQQQETLVKTAESFNSNVNPSNFGAPFSQPQATLLQPTGGLYENAPQPSLAFYRDLNNNNGDLSSDDAIQITGGDGPFLIPANNFYLPYASPYFPYSSRGIPTSHYSTLPQEAMIQLLKSPEQEMSPHSSRPQVKLPFPLSHDCSSGGSSGSKPLQFVVLPIVEPVAPLKPIFPKPSFLSSQYGQFPYIPPFNLFNKKPPVLPTFNLDGISNGPQGQQGGQASGQFVPILNRPAPPLPFVFVQSLPLELIGQNLEMDVLHNSSPQAAALESQINEVTPVAAPLPPSPSPGPRPQMTVENTPSQMRPLPLIVIEKVKKPGQPPSSSVAQAAAVVEISKQSIQKSSGGSSSSGSPPLSTISVIQPITAPGSGPQTLEQQQEIHKAIEKLVPIAASVLENVEQQQQKQQKDGNDQEGAMVPKPILPTAPASEQGSSKVAVTSAQSVPIVDTTKQKEQERSSSLRPPLRPESTQEIGVKVAPPPVKVPQKVPVMETSASEEIVGIGVVNPTSMTHEVEITEA